MKPGTVRRQRRRIVAIPGRTAFVAVILLSLVSAAGGCSSSAVTWTPEEKQNVAYLFKSIGETNHAADVANSLPPQWSPADPQVQRTLAILSLAYADASQVQDSVLTKAHPLLRQKFHGQYLPALRGLIAYFRTGKLPEDQDPVKQLRDFSAWFIHNQNAFRWWRGYPDPRA